MIILTIIGSIVGSFIALFCYPFIERWFNNSESRDKYYVPKGYDWMKGDEK